MKVLIVASGNANKISPFVKDQADALEKQGVGISYFLIKGKGLSGYLANFRKMRKKIAEIKPDIVHAHYGLSGLVSTLQRKVPTVVTFHGSDLNDKKVRPFSKVAHRLATRSIFVSKDLAHIAKAKSPIVIPCGVDLDVFYPMDKKAARKKMGLALDKKYILFSSAFTNEVKNFPLAKKAVDGLGDNTVEILELKGFDRKEVAQLMNAVDVALMTSFTEGSPQFIKEALACGTPIVSTNVGDVKNLSKKARNCFITGYDVDEITLNIQKALKVKREPMDHNDIGFLDNQKIVQEIIGVYQSLIDKNK